MTSPTIAIIGAGPSGLTLARLLQQHSIPFTIYSKETSPTSPSEGGSLDLQPESGQRALRAAGLWESFEKVARYQGQDFKLLDKTGRLLLESVDHEAVRWGHKLLRVEERGDGGFELWFEGREESVHADAVVAADGAWSATQRLVSDVVPLYSSCTMIEVRFRDVDVRCPEVSRLVGRGSFGAYSFERALMGQRNGDGSLRVYILLRAEKSWVSDCGIDFSVPQNARDGLLQYFDDWDEVLKDLIRKCDDDGIVARPLYALPVGHSWVTKPGVTLIGDSAHLMTPFAGQGVNLAMLDALNLSEAIIKDKDDLESAIREYEAEMVERVKVWAQHSANNLELILAEDAPIGFVNLVRQYMPDA